MRLFLVRLSVSVDKINLLYHLFWYALQMRDKHFLELACWLVKLVKCSIN